MEPRAQKRRPVEDYFFPWSMANEREPAGDNDSEPRRELRRFDDAELVESLPIAVRTWQLEAGNLALRH